ncbi:MAG: hypothetical protein BGO07_00330 [Alphaproteobacteria bacterium 40-19]|nr:MAG: hypothetical protein BGO07_00330 [Alphaproteobacteria bacterium 40-19]
MNFLAIACSSKVSVLIVLSKIFSMASEDTPSFSGLSKYLVICFFRSVKAGLSVLFSDSSGFPSGITEGSSLPELIIFFFQIY